MTKISPSNPLYTSGLYLWPFIKTLMKNQLHIWVMFSPVFQIFGTDTFYRKALKGFWHPNRSPLDYHRYFFSWLSWKVIFGLHHFLLKWLMSSGEMSFKLSLKIEHPQQGDLPESNMNIFPMPVKDYWSFTIVIHYKFCFETYVLLLFCTI